MPLDHGAQLTFPYAPAPPFGDQAETAPPAGAMPKLARPRRWSLKRLLIAAAALLFLAAAAGYGHYYWTIGRFLVSTDDAYVQAHSVLISPKVSGYISEVPVDDNQPVKAGQVLAADRPARLPNCARPGARQRRGGAGEHRHAEPADRAAKAGGRAGPASRSLRTRRRSSIRSRISSATRELAKDGYGTVQRSQQSQADIREKAGDAGSATTSGVAVAEKQIGVLEAQLAQAKRDPRRSSRRSSIRPS